MLGRAARPRQQGHPGLVALWAMPRFERGPRNTVFIAAGVEQRLGHLRNLQVFMLGRIDQGGKLRQPDIIGASEGLHARKRSQRFRRSEEHTSELQSLMRISYAVFCLKKKKHNTR